MAKVVLEFEHLKALCPSEIAQGVLVGIIGIVFSFHLAYEYGNIVSGWLGRERRISNQIVIKSTQLKRNFLCLNLRLRNVSNFEFSLISDRQTVIARMRSSIISEFSRNFPMQNILKLPLICLVYFHLIFGCH